MNSCLFSVDSIWNGEVNRDRIQQNKLLGVNFVETSQQEPRAAPLLSELSINHPHFHHSAPCPLNQACVPFTSLRLHSLPPLMREAALVMAALNGAQGGKVHGSLLLNPRPVLGRKIAQTELWMR